MTPPSPEMVERAKELVNEWCDYPGLADSVGPAMDGIGAITALEQNIALALTAAHAQGRAETWKEAIEIAERFAFSGGTVLQLRLAAKPAEEARRG